MAVTREGTPPETLELRLTRRPLLLLLFALPLVTSLFGFGMQQTGAPIWPTPPTVAPERGRIVTGDGTVFAEGSVDARRWPQGTLAAQTIGFSGRVQPDGRYGLEGLEYALDAHLQTGADAVVTLDPVLQSASERHLAAAIEEHEAENGSVVMLEVGSGRILAAASHPTFDPNDRSGADRLAMTNQAFLNQYEPGSVMKPFVIASLLQAGRLDATEPIDAPPTLRVGAKTFRDVAVHDPVLDASDVLRYSSNTAMLRLTERFAPHELHAWYRHFGFDASVPMRSAFTRPGSIVDPDAWVPQDQASITIGQAMTTTPLQLAAAYSVFANDGVYVAPRLVEAEEPLDRRRVLDADVSRTVRDMLIHTVEGSGLNASRIPGVRTAGKTGTADIWSSEHGTYPDGWYSLTFAGFFPADAPEVVMVVMLQKPRVNTSSTYVAAPLFRAIGSEVVAHWGVAPEPDPLIAGATDLP